MRESVKIALKKPLTGHSGEKISAIVLREPTYDEYMSIGDPWTVASGAGGTPFAVENPEIIRQYIQTCLVEPKDPGLLAQAGAFVARQVKEKLLGFFQPDASERTEADEASATSPMNSSSGDTANSAPQKSSS